MATTRVRFAPSPTGFFHIGSARTALFNWLYARHTGGALILRIEDTDKARNTEEALRVLFDGMRWLGLDWDEGPEVGGDYGPYFQSERGEIYQEALKRLQDSGRVYEREGALWFRVEGERETVYDEFRKKEVEKVRAAPVVIEDAVRGRVERPLDEDFVVIRASGDPVFHFVNVVDDITMGITHVIRGEDHLSNTPKHIALFAALGAPVPTYAHIPLILKTDGQGKMSKRDRGALVEEYANRHFLPAAVRNYLCLLGWSPKDDREKIPLDELIALFDLPGINKGNARFDEQKLIHLNAAYLDDLPLESYTWLARPILEQANILPPDLEEDYLQAVLAICRGKVALLEDLPGFTSYFFQDDFPYDPEAHKRVFKKGDPLAALREARDALATVEDFREPEIESALTRLAEQSGGKPFAYYPILRYAASGRAGGPDLMALLRVLGKERLLQRIDRLLAQ